ncbi:hypothetical protein [Burkholderia ubonensis]|uniref:hypothetical protein n=1 Tax=Burkholderia ubonensis TaxID=101571 RepID=UPI00075573B0|nr:hypothetical protein [Burkholderia ubonensis]KVP16772.1 hypothetical protein WJ84_00430 [Burkholderia ubonensis]
METVYTIENGVYVMSLGNKRIVVGPEVAILFDQKSSLVLKHGAPARVQDDADTTRRRLTEEGFHALAEDLVVITGAFDLEELNKVMSGTNYIGLFYQNLLAERRVAA